MLEFAPNDGRDAVRPVQPVEILVLDDDPTDRMILCRSMAKLGGAVNITEVADLATFHDKVQQRAYDLVMIDYNLADDDGMQAIKICKDREFNKNALFVMVTGDDRSSLTVNALRTGFDDFLRKDEVNEESLGTILTATAERRQALGPRFSIFAHFRDQKVRRREVFEEPLRKSA